MSRARSVSAIFAWPLVLFVLGIAGLVTGGELVLRGCASRR